MMTLDGFLHFYLIIMMILNQLSDKSVLKALNVISFYTESDLTSYAHIIIQSLVLAFFISIAIAFLIIAKYTHSLSTLMKTPGLKKLITFLFVSLMTYLQIPLLELTIGCLFLKSSDSLTDDLQIKGLRIALFTLSGINLAFLLGYVFLLQKLFIIRIPSITIHWAASNTQLHSMKLLNKILLVVSHLYATKIEGGETFIYLTIPCFLLIITTGLTRVLLIPHYRAIVDFLTRLTELLSGCLLLLLIVAQIIHKRGGNTAYEDELKADMKLPLLLAFLSIPSILVLSVVLDYHRKKQLWMRLEKGELKLEIEYEYALYLLIERIKAAMGTDDKSTLAFADLLYLVESHSQGCHNENCACKRTEIVQYMMNKGNIFGMNKIILKEDEINLLNSASTNVFVQSNKNPSKMKTLTLFQNFNFYAIEMAANRDHEIPDPGMTESLRPISSQKMMTMRTEKSVKAVQPHQRDIHQVRVNIGQLKLTYMNQFAEIFFEDVRRRFPDSKRLFFQYAYFTLQCCRNRFMTETLLRNFEATVTSSGQKVSWIEQVSIMVNELQTIMEIERLEDIKNGKQSANYNNNEEEESMAPSDAANWGVTYLKNGKERDDNMINGSTKAGIYSSMDKFDPEYFILVSELTGKFYEEVEHLALSVSNFWKLVQSETLEVEQLHKESISLANIIAQIYKVFKELEQVTEEGPNMGRSSDFRVCYTFALLQKTLLNDLVQYELYLQKMNSQREMIRLLHNNMLSQAKGPDNTGFILVHGQSKKFGKVIMCNQVIRKQLGFSSKEISHLNILDFMPSLIKNWHQGFVQEFTKNGGASNGMLNKTNCLFMRRKNGYVVPAMVNVKFHYQKEHEFTFVCYTHFLKDIQISRTSGAGRHKVGDVLFFICDDHDGRIFELSESCSKQLGLSVDVLYNHDMENQVSNFTIEDICPTLSFKKLKQLRDEAESGMGNMGDGVGSAIESIVDIDLNIIQNNVNSQQAYATYAPGNQNHNKIQKALCQVFLEQYGINKDKSINIVALVLLDQLAMREYLKQKKKARSDKKDRQSQRRDDDRVRKLIEDARVDEEHGAASQSSVVSGFSDSRGSRNNRDENDASGSLSQSHSSRTGTSETSMLKQLYQSTEKTASSSLKLITQMIAVVFVLLIVVSSINLILSLTRNDQLQLEVMTVRRSYDRLAIHSKIRVLLRGILNMANGYEPMDISEISKDRFSMYMNELESQVIKLKDVQDFLDRVDFEYSDTFKNKLNSKIIPLEYLGISNELTIQDQTLSYAMNLFIQRTSILSNWDVTKFKGKVKSIHQIGRLQKGYSPTEDERTLYFLVQAGSGKMRYISKIISELYQQETIDHAMSVASQTQLTIIISIVAIVLVSIIISPIICRIEERKYTGLKFFLNVEPSHLNILEDQVQDFLSQAFSDASVHTSSTHQELNVILDRKRLRRQQNRNGEVFLSSASSRRNGSQSSSSVDAARDQADAEMDECESDTFASGQVEEQTSIRVEYSNNQKTSQQESSPEKKEPTPIGDYLNRAITRNHNESTKVLAAYAFMQSDPKKMTKLEKSDEYQVQYSNKKKNGKLEALKSSDNSIAQLNNMQNQPIDQSMNKDSLQEEPFDEIAFAKQQEEDMKNAEEHAQARKVILEEKFERIIQMAQRQKYKTMIGIFILAMFFSSYFIAGYFFSVNSFSQTPEILGYLDTIFFKDVSLEIAIGFVRQNQMSNETLYSTEDPQMTGVDYYLIRSEGREKSYLNIRRHMPSLFSDIRTYFDNIETDKLCQIANKGVSTLQIDRLSVCKSVYHGLLTNGLTYTMNLILSHFRNINLNFKAMLPQDRTISYLKESLADITTLQLIETKDFVLDSVFYDLKDVVTQATTDYYALLIKQYTTLYAIFVLLMTALFLLYLFFGYDHIKDTMWKTNLTLKIMPLDFIPRHCLPELKAFFRY